MRFDGVYKRSTDTSKQTAPLAYSTLNRNISMSIIKESLFLCLLWFSSMSLAATESNQSLSTKASDTRDFVFLSPIQTDVVNQSFATANVDYQSANQQFTISDFSADAAAFGGMLMQPVGFFNLSNHIKQNTFSPVSLIRTVDTPSTNTNKHYEFWSMFLVGFMLVLGQIAGVKNSGSDLKLAPLKS
jgi:hypothetical protein